MTKATAIPPRVSMIGLARARVRAAFMVWVKIFSMIAATRRFSYSSMT